MRIIKAHDCVVTNTLLPSADTRSINAFRVGNEYVFKHRFPEDVYDELRRFYNAEEYRFDVPVEDIHLVERLLKANAYDLKLIEDVEEYCVVRSKGEEQQKRLFERTVLRRSTRYHHAYLLKDQAAVEEAVYHGAERLIDTELDDIF